MKLTPEQYNELKTVEQAYLQAEANLQKTKRLLGLALDKSYSVTIAVEEVVMGKPIQPEEAGPKE